MDSNDRDRVVEARDELHRMLNEVYHLVKSISVCNIQNHQTRTDVQASLEARTLVNLSVTPTAWKGLTGKGLLQLLGLSR